MTKLQELAQDGSPGYSVDSRGLLRISNKVYIPENPSTLAALLIRHVHEQPSTGHPGRNRMVCLLSARFHLKNLAQRVAKHLKNCPVCCKLARHTGPAPLLRPLPVPDAPWRDISVDFLGPLPTPDEFNMIMVVVDQLTKMRQYIRCMAKEADSGTSALPWPGYSSTTYSGCKASQTPSCQTVALNSSLHSGNTSRPHSVSSENSPLSITPRQRDKWNGQTKTERTTYGGTSAETG